MSNNSDDRDRGAVAVESGCPSAHVLAAFASGILSDQELVAIAGHVSSCDSCEHVVRGLSGDDTLAERLRAGVQHGAPFDESAFERMQEAAKAICPPSQESITLAIRQLAGSGARRLAAERPAPAADAPLPRAIGRYQVRSELGRGGFGSVFLAHDADLDRPVAIKVPRFDADVSSERVHWFLDEARTAARLKHPGIIAVYEVGRLVDDSCYIVMEYVEGRSLAAQLATEKLPPARVVQIIAQAARAIHYAHKQGLVHRDLKPGNILLDAAGQVKIADFGLALHEDQQRSRAGERAGTLVYMSPEQVRGDAHRLDGRSDIWALGVILYELLCGKRPFSGTKEEMADEILHRSPRPLRQIRDDIDPALEAICLKCLAKKPDQRYSSAMDLAEALQAWQGETLEQTMDLGPAPRSKPPAPRHPAAILAIAAAVCLLAAAASAWKFWPRGPEQPFRVDPLARPLVWLSLATQPPEELRPNTPIETWHYDPVRQHVEINSNAPTILSLGETRSGEYALQATLTKNRNGQGGTAGIFLGYEQVEGKQLWRCHLISVRQVQRVNDDGSKTDELLLERETLEYDETGFSRIKVAWVQLPWQLVEQSELEVTVRDHAIRSVSWQKRPVLGLSGSEFAKAGHAPGCTGRFGLMNDEGSTIFSDLQFMSLRSNKQ